MIKFNSNHLVVGYIKEMLKDFNLPKCPGCDDGHHDLYIEDNYIKRDGKKLFPYNFNKPYLNITKNLKITNNIYDSYTHRYLGDFLRFIRDYRGLNLMSLYNCYANELCHSIDLSFNKYTESGVGGVESGNYKEITFSTKDDNYKIFMVPVKFGQQYTIGIDCETQVEIVACFYNNNKLITLTNELYDNEFYEDTYMKLGGLRFKHPILYTKLMNELNVDWSELYKQEQNLTLFIKVPSSNKSALTVLEGDYVDDCNVYFDKDKSLKGNFYVYNYKPNKEESGYKGPYERKFIARPQLFYINSKVSYPFADRLIEYLLGNVITPDDEFDKNIVRIQNKLTKIGKMATSFLGYPGVWNDNLRNAIYDTVHIKKIEKAEFADTVEVTVLESGEVIKNDLEDNIKYNVFDILGYVDKEAEDIIGD